MSTEKTAILFFSRTQQDEFSAKPLGIGRSRFSNLYKFLTKKTLSTAKDTGLPVIESYSDQQQGTTFSERLINELREVANRGFERVVIIGNDTPELCSEDILTAKDQLSEGKHVLGEDKRGGAYLIGLNLQGFDFARLDLIRWNSNSVHKQLIAQLGAVFELTSKTDINDVSDIRVLIKNTIVFSRGMIAFLLNCLSGVNQKVINLNLSELSVIPLSTYRGPPKMSL